MQAQVENFDHTFSVDQKVRRFDVAMDQTHIVRMLQTFRRLADIVRRYLIRQRPLFANYGLKIRSVDKLHHQIVSVFLIIDVECLNDIGMRKRRNRFRFLLEPLKIRVIAELVLRKHLHGSFMVHHHMLGQVNRTHTAGTKMPKQLVLAQEKNLCTVLATIFQSANGLSAWLFQTLLPPPPDQREGFHCFPLPDSSVPLPEPDYRPVGFVRRTSRNPGR